MQAEKLSGEFLQLWTRCLAGSALNLKCWLDMVNVVCSRSDCLPRPVKTVLIFFSAGNMCHANLQLAVVSCQCGGAHHGCSLTSSRDHAGQASRFHFLEAVLITLLCGCMNILTVKNFGTKC